MRDDGKKLLKSGTWLSLVFTQVQSGSLVAMESRQVPPVQRPDQRTKPINENQVLLRVSIDQGGSGGHARGFLRRLP
jgi:hypothetical protein